MKTFKENAIDRYKEILGNNYLNFEDYFNKNLPQTIRVNTIKKSHKDLLQRFKTKNIETEKVSFLKDAYYAKGTHSLASMPEYLQGYFFIQSLASQLVSEILNPTEYDLVCDMCAAPGSKTTHLAQLMNNKGNLIAIDINPIRIVALKNNLERCDVKNTVIYELDGTKLSTKNLEFDKISLDAPCSGNFSIDKDWLYKRRLIDFKEKSKVQKELIKEAIICLKTGGILVYSTCSLEPEENEEVVQYALDNFNVKLLDIELKIGLPGLNSFEDKKYSDEISKTVRIYPHLHNTHGFFIAKLTKI